MSFDPTLPVNPTDVLHLYDLHAEKPNWLLAFDATPRLYGVRGLQDFLAYLDSILSQAGIGPTTKEKFQQKRDEVQVILDEKQAARTEPEPREFVCPSDFND